MGQKIAQWQRPGLETSVGDLLRRVGILERKPSGTATINGHVIEDEGTPLTQRANLNFVGAGVTAADSGGDTVVTIPGGSGGSDIGARATRGTDQSIVDSSGSGTWYGLDLTTENFDTDGIHSIVTDTSRFTAVHAGKYLCWAQVWWEANATGYRQLGIYSNTLSPTVGSGYVAVDIQYPNGSILMSQTVSTVHSLGVGDYVEFQVRQASTVTLKVLAIPIYSPSAGITKLLG